jgi:electron transfer flavoprotein alpha subunit
MKFTFRVKHHFFSAFRELFVHHHGSLEFRAKVFALVIAANENISVESYIVVKNYGLSIYKDDEDRANLLMLSTKELVQKVKDNNGLNIDMLITHIQKELKIVPRYAKKIDIEALKQILDFTYDEDTLLYQKNILGFLEKLKDETLNTKKIQIEESEESLESKY